MAISGCWGVGLVAMGVGLVTVGDFSSVGLVARGVGLVTVGDFQV